MSGYAEVGLRGTYLLLLATYLLPPTNIPLLTSEVMYLLRIQGER